MVFDWRLAARASAPSIDLPYERAVERNQKALNEQGFGVLAAVVVRQTMKAKLDDEFRPYVILGACKPPRRTAHSALISAWAAVQCAGL